MTSRPNTDLTGQVSYHEINAMVRLGQRNELEAYFRQFLIDLEAIAENDLRLGRSRLVSLITILVNSILEIGASPDVEGHIADIAQLASDAKGKNQLVETATHYLKQMNVCAKPNANRIATQMVEKAKGIVHIRYSENLNDEKIASEIGMSRSHFRYLFKEATGIPFKRYLTEMRLNIARTMLESTKSNVKEVCFNVGYSDTSSFYRAYRAYHGVAPNTHRLATL